MKFNSKKLYEAIFLRKSRRSYISKEIEENKIKELKAFALDLTKELGSIRIEFIKMSSKKVFGSALNSYGSITGANMFIVFLTNKKEENLYRKIGYIGELLILKATELNLGTCWIGGLFKKDIIGKKINISNDENIIAISPIGYTNEKKTIREKIIGKLVSSNNRKELKHLVIDKKDVELDKKDENILKALQLSPSALNRQPWKFVVKNNSIKILMDKNNKKSKIPFELDCGIAFAHLDVAIQNENFKIEGRSLDDFEIVFYRSKNNK